MKTITEQAQELGLKQEYIDQLEIYAAQVRRDQERGLYAEVDAGDLRQVALLARRLGVGRGTRLADAADVAVKSRIEKNIQAWYVEREKRTGLAPNEW